MSSVGATAITSGQQLLLPDSTRKLRKERKVTIAVNSRDRNTVSWPDSNNFRWTLRRPLKDVTCIELVNGCVPADLYNVAPDWAGFTFQEIAAGTTRWEITLPSGQYTATELAGVLQAALTGLPGGTNTYAVSYSGQTKKYTITATGAAAFSFLFATGVKTDTVDATTGAIMQINTPARLLGFGRTDVGAAGGASLISTYRADPEAPIKRLYLHINADNSVDLHRVESGAGRRDCFHVLYLGDTKDGYYMLNKDIHMPIFYSAPAPISRITTLNISLRDESYRLVDLSRHDYTLLFEVTFLD
jgi:hypothetical protein